MQPWDLYYIYMDVLYEPESCTLSIQAGKNVLYDSGQKLFITNKGKLNVIIFTLEVINQ